MLKLFNKYTNNITQRPITPIYKYPNYLPKNDLLYNKFPKINPLSIHEKFKVNLDVDPKKDESSNNYKCPMPFILLIAIIAFVIYKRQNLD